MKKLIIHSCIVVSVLGSIVYAANSNSMSTYTQSFWDYKVLQTIEDRVVTTQESFDEEELIYQLGLIAKYEERMQDDAQASYLLAESRKMILLSLTAVEKQKEAVIEKLGNQDEDSESDEILNQETKLLDSTVSSIPVTVDDASSDDQSQVSSVVINSGGEEMYKDTADNQAADNSVPVVGLGFLEEGLPVLNIDSGDSVVTDIGTPNADISYTPGGLYAEFSDLVDGDISGLCTVYYDQIDQIAKRNDFPTSLIIAMRYREHSCIFSNPDNGRGNFQITSHYYEPGEVSRNQFASQVQEFIDFSRAKRSYYDSIQRFGPEPVSLSYDSMDINSIRKHAILYNGVYPDVTLESSWYSNENFTQHRGGRDGVVATVLKVIKWVEER